MNTQRIKTLDCSCCGSIARNRQHWNMDTGYGVCRRCANSIEAKEGAEYVADCFGKRGYNFDIEGESE